MCKCNYYEIVCTYYVLIIDIYNFVQTHFLRQYYTNLLFKYFTVE